MLGAAVGLGVGLLSAYLYTRAAEENGGKTLSMGQLIKLGLVIVGAVRQITEAAKKNGERV